jgi:hypothetical protein
MATAARSLGPRYGRETSPISGRLKSGPPIAVVVNDVDDEAKTAGDGAAEHVQDGQGTLIVGRYDNRDNPSPSEMAEMLREIQDSLAALDERLAGLEGAQGVSSTITRRLALDVVEMGQTLAKRVRSLEQGVAEIRTPEPPAPPAIAADAAPFIAPRSRLALATFRAGSGNTIVTALVAAAFTGAIALGVWMVVRHEGDAAARTEAAARARLDAAAAAALQRARHTSSVQPAAPAPTTVVARPVHHYTLYRVRRAATGAADTPTPAAEAEVPTGFGSYGPAPGVAQR